MTAPRPEPVFAICPMETIAIGEAKPFDLVRLDAEGAPRPFRIVVLRPDATHYLGYVNACPHQGTWLNVGSGSFFDEARTHLKCQRHGARFDVNSGRCVAGPCEGRMLTPVTVIADRGDICVVGEPLAEDDGPRYGGEDETMEIMVHPG